jgi:hypothetical protein
VVAWRSIGGVAGWIAGRLVLWISRWELGGFRWSGSGRKADRKLKCNMVKKGNAFT